MVDLLRPLVTRISIHSPHARGDVHFAKSLRWYQHHFNPLPSCEGRQAAPTPARRAFNFNPLPSCEGRPGGSFLFHDFPRISIHSPHARGDGGCAGRVCGMEISIHSPHARGDAPRRADQRRSVAFQSTPLMRGETQYLTAQISTAPFQSTPLMRGETSRWRIENPFSAHFNPLPSCEGRHAPRKECKTVEKFQSTPLMRGETWPPTRTR